MNRFWQLDNGLMWFLKNMPEKRIVIDFQKDLFLLCYKKSKRIYVMFDAVAKIH